MTSKLLYAALAVSVIAWLESVRAEGIVAPMEATSQQKKADDQGIFSVVWENDVFANTDRNYSNGIRFAWFSPEKNLPQWVNWTANLFPVARAGNKRTSVAVGQSMFTPDDIEREGRISTDRPYAGWLYGTVGVVSDTDTTLDNVQLTIGVVGPYAYAGQTQKFVHRLMRTRDPKGWDHQLETEPGIVLTYEREWRRLYQFSPFGLGFDATPKFGVNLGNIFTDAAAGITLRLGYDLPSDYGPPRIRPSLPGSDFFIPTKTLGWYLFGGAEGRAIARNIFLDGNTFRESHHVDKEYAVGSAHAGLALTYDDARVSYTHVFQTREFEDQKEPSQFGALTLSLRF